MWQLPYNVFACKLKENPSLSNFQGWMPVVLGLAVSSWWRWCVAIVRVNRLASQMRHRVALLAIPIFCLGFFVVILRLLASSDVRTDTFYVGFYSLVGAGWLGSATFVFPLLGISARDDVIERRNASASWAISGALIGVTLCFAGANTGNGPGLHAVLFCAILSTSAFFLLWLGVEMLAAPSEAVTVERDTAAGMRLGGFLVALAIILGGAVAGPWQSVSATMRDLMRVGWPALPLAGVATFVERSRERGTRPLVRRILNSAGIAPVYIVAAAVYVALRGDWS